MENKSYHTKGVRYIIISLLFFLSVACGNHVITLTLDQAEDAMQDQPDESLRLIRSIDTLSLNSNFLKARYSLLLAMALDKNYIDTTNVRVVMPAVDYYRKHGTADERMKSFYYLGRIQENAGDLNAAAVSFSLGENEVKNATDYQMEGLLYMAFSDIYNKTRDLEKEEEYVRKGIAAFEESGDVKHSNLCDGRLAIVKYSKQEWSVADSLFRAGIEKAATDTIAMSVFLSNYARMKMVMPEQDPEGALSLLYDLTNKYHRQLSLSDYGVLAYASLLTGDYRTCQNIESYFNSLPSQQIVSVSFWLSKIEQYKENYKTALEYDIQSFAFNTQTFEKILSHSVTQTLQDHYEQAAIDAKKDAKITTLTIVLISVVIVVFLILLLFYSRWRHERKREEVERLLRISEESNRILQEANADLELQTLGYKYERQNLQDQVESYSRKVDEIRMTGAELEETLNSLRKSYASTYKDKFSAIGELCNAYLETKDRTDKKDIIFRRVESLIAYISDDERLHMRFENQINKDLNNIVKRLKTDLGDVDEKESRFICYCIVGFEPQMIGTVLGLSLSNVYTKKSRLKDKIRRLESPYREEYLRML